MGDGAMEDLVLVTGFGPFSGHNVNASWEAVKLLPERKIEGVKIVVQEIPVVYSYIEEKVPLLWKQYNPKLVIHVGVSNYANKLTLETAAHRNGYRKKDCLNNYHPTGEACCKEDAADCLKTSLNVEAICDQLNKTDVKACCSLDAGRYLCEFIFYKSLQINRERTIFVHVPPVGRPYSAEEVASGLVDIIKCALRQLENRCVANDVVQQQQQQKSCEGMESNFSVNENII